jgi:hypothetical protein
MFTLSSAARAETRTLLAAETRGAILDIALSPNPAAPCLLVGDRHPARRT